MIWKTSSNKSSLFRNAYLQALKKGRGVCILYAGLLFLALPVIQFTASGLFADSNPGEMAGLIQILTLALVLPLTLIFIAVFTVMLFGYMHNRRSVDLFHSLPIPRETLLGARICAALTLLYVPLLLNGLLVTLGTAVLCKEADKVIFSCILPCFGHVLLGVAMCLALTVFMCVCSGTLMSAIVSSLGICIAWPAVFMLGNTLLAQILPCHDFTVHPLLFTALSPFSAMFLPHFCWADDLFAIGSYTDIPALYYVWWSIFTVTLFAASLLIYRRRKSEYAESQQAFPWLKAIIQLLGTLAFSFGFGFILFLFNESDATFLIAGILGGFAMHAIIEGLYSKGFKRFKKSLPVYGVFVVVFVLFYVVASYGLFGYDMRIPDAKDIAYVELHTSPISVDPEQVLSPEEDTASYFSSYDISDGIRVTNQRGKFLGRLYPSLDEPENIEKVCELHRLLILYNRSRNGFPYHMQMDFYSYDCEIIYYLKNGRSVTRTLRLPDFRFYTDDNTSTMEQCLTIAARINELLFSEDYRAETLLSVIGPAALTDGGFNLWGSVEDGSFLPTSIPALSEKDWENAYYMLPFTAQQQKALYNAYQKEITQVDLLDSKNYSFCTQSDISLSANINNFRLTDIPESGHLHDIAGNNKVVFLSGYANYPLYYDMPETVKLLYDCRVLDEEVVY